MKLKVILFLLCTSLVSQIAIAQQDSIKTKKKLSFRDPEDGAFDLSQFLLEANGVLPIVIPIHRTRSWLWRWISTIVFSQS